MIGNDKRITIRKKKFVLDAPSIFAESSNSLGIVVMKKVLVTIRLKTDTALGTNTAQIVLIIPNPLTTRYFGMMPPEKNMVNTIKNMKIFLPGKSFLDRSEERRVGKECTTKCGS